MHGVCQTLTLFAMQDFLKEVDIRFMDQVRRGASIVATDLARAPQPASLRDCYQLMCLTAPEVDQIEASISTIKEEIDMRKAAVADKEALLANHNPPVFQAVQVCPPHVSVAPLRTEARKFMPAVVE